MLTGLYVRGAHGEQIGGGAMNTDFNQATWHDDFMEIVGKLPSEALRSKILSHVADLIKQEPDGPRFTVYTAADALKPQEPPAWIVDQLIQDAGVCLVVGSPGSKKTWLLLDLAVCVALGIDWLGKPVKSCPVLLIDEESGPRRLMHRLGQVLRGHQAEPDVPVYCTSLAGFNLANSRDYGVGSIDAEKHTREIAGLIQQTGARLVIMDALADIALGAEENSVREMHPVLSRLRRIADETQAAIVLIHHTGKAGVYRGSSAISGAVDLMLMCESKAESHDIKLVTEKVRDTEPQTFSAKIQFCPDRVYLLASATDETAHLPPTEDFIVSYLDKHGPATMDALQQYAAANDIAKAGSVKNAVFRLRDRGIVRRVNEGGPGKPARYGLAGRGDRRNGYHQGDGSHAEEREIVVL
ncbi:MAG: AAA family ATPase [Chloroflexi bacterium]|nr:AAA family ATPase [Chloroflexota bacterium]